MIRIVRRWRSGELLLLLLLATLSPLSKFIAADATVSIGVHLIEDSLGSVEVRTGWLTVRRLWSSIEVIRGLHRNVVRFHGAVVDVQHHVRAEIFAVRLMGWRLIEVSGGNEDSCALADGEVLTVIEIVRWRMNPVGPIAEIRPE